jgi:hypothetical protein
MIDVVVAIQPLAGLYTVHRLAGSPYTRNGLAHDARVALWIAPDEERLPKLPHVRCAGAGVILHQAQPLCHQHRLDPDV